MTALRSQSLILGTLSYRSLHYLLLAANTSFPDRRKQHKPVGLNLNIENVIDRMSI